MAEQVDLRLDNIGKKFYNRWLFRKIEHHLSFPSSLVLKGSNGSGKSTLLRIISGQMNPSEGKVSLKVGEKQIPADKFYQYISWAGPYLEVYKDLNIDELFNLHFSLKSCLFNDLEELVSILNLKPHRNKKLQYFSSGMLQRAVVGMALFSDTPVLLLDEPTSFMDEKNASMMLEHIDNYSSNRIFVLASNMSREFEKYADIIDLGGG
ncbi:MAG: ATP-binding cassette domain-containing protein [Bacteroidia bacterium]|nr:ATP-binding cassette domain-containing protein [Bacteroidia bacterium]